MRPSRILALGIWLSITLAVIAWVSSMWIKHRSTQALYSACQSGNVPAVRRWITANWNTRETKWHKDALYNAVFEVIEPEFINDYDEVKAEKLVTAMVESRTDPNDSLCGRLFLASSNYGYTKVIQKLIQRGIDVDWREGDGPTALANAAGLGNVEVTRILLENGADPNTSFGDQFLGRHNVLSLVKAKESEATAAPVREVQTGPYAKVIAKWQADAAKSYQAVRALLHRYGANQKPK